MKIVCSQSDLKDNLSLVSRIVPSRPEPAVLGNVLIEAAEAIQKISIIAFDGNLGIKTSFNGSVIEGGSITLPAKLFNDIVTRLPEMEITIDVADSEGEIVATISSSSGQFKLTGIDSEEFPELPTIEAERIIELPIFALNEGLGGCLFAASTELSKQVLTGVHLKTQGIEESDRGKILEFAATDSHRLAVVAADLNAEDAESEIQLPEFAVTIPAKALRELERILGDAQSTDRVKVSFDEQIMRFELGDRLLTSAKIPGDYPAYGQLIPRNFAREMIVDRKRLLSSLELVAVLAQKNNLVKFSLNSDRGELTVSADAQDIGNAKQSISAEIIGEDIEIAFNIKYLVDGLKALPAAEIKMQLNEWNQPVVFSPLSGLDMTYLVMPVQIRN
ncbi:MAG: DNA polymerase III subunit beta [Pleurocapsa sp. MO_226.B13]|nr:DNA polymerase III subunit beta [Pleurocapsa sp. MO_226.B13]